MANELMDKEKLKDIVMDCNAIQAIAINLNDSLRTCIVDLNGKVRQDNYGTRSNKDGEINQLIDNANIVKDVENLGNLIMNSLQQKVN